MNKCPKCGGESGFAYTLMLKTHRVGSWGIDDDEESFAERVYDPTTVTCMDCNKRISWDIAHGLSNPTTGAADKG